MKRWMLAMCVLGGLTACQTDGVGTDPVTSAQDQALTGDPCAATMPPLDYWKGQPVPAPGSTQLYIVVPSPHAQGEHVASLVDYSTAKVVYATRVANSSLGALLAKLGGYGRIVIPGTPPPPPDIMGALMVFSAQRYSLVYDEAYADAKSCSAK